MIIHSLKRTSYYGHAMFTALMRWQIRHQVHAYARSCAANVHIGHWLFPRSVAFDQASNVSTLTKKAPQKNSR